jgi:hypothetical protein
MPDYPEPLSPQDCDLRNFPFMSLDVVRLRDSEVASIDPEAFRAAVLSWCAAWHQVPAGSLPDDDAALCRLLGYGRDLKTWMKVRAAGALQGYVKCSDNRIYHPVVAAKACEAWEKKQAQRNRTEAARLARLAGRSDSLSQRKAASVTDTVTTPDTDAVTDYATDIVTGSKGEDRIGEEKESELCSGAKAPQDARATLWRDGLVARVIQSEG